MQISEFSVDGMGCGGCASKVEAIALDVAGVIDCVVNFERKQATVHYNPQITTAEKIQQTLVTAGYGVYPLQQA
ncbi:MAG: heavy-metal-associated domain-containing protein [Cyanothece sp. SIO2G6]|nr:heavy-metal-associated domain-containing protein [Cyanothece sp. SIO2G6]